MGNRILVDTSVLVEAQHGNSLIKESLLTNRQKIAISRVTAYEVIHGSRDKAELKGNKQVLERIEILEINEEISKLAYSLLEKYVLKTKLNLPDALITATAMIFSIPIWTLNSKHFKPIREIELFEE